MAAFDGATNTAHTGEARLPAFRRAHAEPGLYGTLERGAVAIRAIGLGAGQVERLRRGNGMLGRWRLDDHCGEDGIRLLPIIGGSRRHDHAQRHGAFVCRQV